MAESRTDFDPKQAPKGWDYEKQGKPDILFWRYAGEEAAQAAKPTDVESLWKSNYEVAEEWRDTEIRKAEEENANKTVEEEKQPTNEHMVDKNGIMKEDSTNAKQQNGSHEQEEKRRDDENIVKFHRVASDTPTSVEWKTHDYILNNEHPVGKSKAEWFERALGISRKNAEVLNRQVIFDADKAIKTAETEYGIKYNQITTIVGANGRKIDVIVVWIKNNDGVVRLVTIIPKKK